MNNSGEGTGEELDFVDIGVGSTSPGHRRSSQRAPGDRDGAAPSRRSPRQLLGVAAVVVAVIVLVGQMFGGDPEVGQQVERPPITSPPEVLTPFPRQGSDVEGDPARPAPTPTVRVPVVSDGLTRAGEDCSIAFGDDDYLADVVFTIPDGRTMRDCPSGGVLLRDPRSKSESALGSIFVSNQDLGATLNMIRGTQGESVESAVWRPVNGLPAYRIALRADDLGDVDQVDVIGFEQRTLVVHRRNRDFAPGIGESIDELVRSVRIEGRPLAVLDSLPMPGGWCAGEHYVTKVPDNWFSGEACRWLNTSSESPTVLQCECLPPLWIEHVSIQFGDDYGFAQVNSDELVQRDDGSTIRIIEGLRRDPNNMDRPLRAVIVDGGVERVVVVAAQFPEHALPGHTWQDTLDAQQFLVDNLRFHSQPSCGDADRLVARSAGGPFVEIQVGSDTLGLPSGSAVVATACTRIGARGVQAEVRLEARPEIVGWVDEASLASADIVLCPSAEGTFNPTDWDEWLPGDFDGDGREDRAYLRASSDGWSASDELHDQVPDVAVLFANGGLATGSTGRVGSASVERFVGMGRDSLALTIERGAMTEWALHSVSACAVEPVFEARHGTDQGRRAGLCRTRSGLSDSLRTWEESLDDWQGWVTAVDRRWGPSTSFGPTDRALSVRAAAEVCGPSLNGGLAAVRVGLGDPAVVGVHGLSLQWLSGRDASEGGVLFDPLDSGGYQVTGIHQTERGELVIAGVIEIVSRDELAFDGTISSRVPWLNGGEACERVAGQRFIRRPGTDTFRMQDRINCDGARTDWIDITIAGLD